MLSPDSCDAASFPTSFSVSFANPYPRQTPPETLTRFASAIGWALRALQAEQAPLSVMERVLQEAMVGIEGMTVVEQWKAEGKAEGESETARQMLEMVLIARFGALPEAVREALRGADAEAMKEWHRVAPTAPTLEAAGIRPQR